MKVLNLILTIIMLGPIICMGQENIPIGTWRNHFSFNNVRQTVDAGNKIYSAASNGIFCYDREDNSITTITTLEGLQEEEISTLAFNSQTDQLLIGYASGNLDIIENNSIFNIDLLSTSQIVGSKAINDIAFRGSVAFLITDFGALQFDLDKREVTETYRELSDSFGRLQVYEATIYNDSIFLASEDGVLAANVTGSVNLLNPENWLRFGVDEGIPTDAFQVITSTDKGVLIGNQADGLFFYNESWARLNLFENQGIVSLTSVSGDALLVADSGIFKTSNLTEFERVEVDLVTDVNDAIYDEESNIWIADRINGLVTNTLGDFRSIVPSGPFGDKIFRLKLNNNRLLGLPGGFNESIRPLNCDLGYYSFENGFWSNFNSFDATDPFPVFNDITGIIEQTTNSNTIFSSAKDGLLNLRQDGTFEIINHLTIGSPLQTSNIIEDEVIIPSILQTSEGIWVLNFNSTQPLHLWQLDGSWVSYSLPSTSVIDLIEVGNTLWILPNPETIGGIIVFDKETGDTRYLTDASGNGGLASRGVRSLALDLEGFVWAGTSDGVSVFTNPFNIFNGEVEAIEPIFDNRLLLRGEEITSIKVDGGNQKWIGTRNGVWLFDDQADEQIFNFTVDNSPLPSNNVLDIEINPATGEVFFATEAGMVSFRGGATVAAEQHQDVQIFPNPVNRDFNGQLGISGLARDAIIKITDISGKLIFETQANGGTIAWDLSNYRGGRATSGVYLVFSSTSDGEETFVGKIAVIE